MKSDHKVQKYEGGDGMEPGGLLRIGHVSKMLGISAVTLRKWRKRGVGPEFVVIGGSQPGSQSIWYKRATIEAFIAHKEGR